MGCVCRDRFVGNNVGFDAARAVQTFRTDDFEEMGRHCDVVGPDHLVFNIPFAIGFGVGEIEGAGEDVEDFVLRGECPHIFF